jgi:hypothetical protein
MFTYLGIPAYILTRNWACPGHQEHEHARRTPSQPMIFGASDSAILSCDNLKQDYLFTVRDRSQTVRLELPPGRDGRVRPGVTPARRVRKEFNSELSLHLRATRIPSSLNLPQLGLAGVHRAEAGSQGPAGPGPAGPGPGLPLRMA